MQLPPRLQAQFASVCGARHRLTARNRQDAALATTDGAAGIAVVCDGCGSMPNSEIGAQLGVSMWTAAVSATLAQRKDIGDRHFWLQASQHVLGAMRAVVTALCGDKPDADRQHWTLNHLLFTSMVAVVYHDQVAIWAIGDGLYAIDGVATVVSAADNAPAYLAYELLATSDRQPLDQATLHTGAVTGDGFVAVATDGLRDLPQGLASLLTDQFVRHPDALRRTLEVAARNVEHIDWSTHTVARIPAPLQDDASVAIIGWSLPC
jgi:Protein phosphatase 2C